MATCSTHLIASPVMKLAYSRPNTSRQCYPLRTGHLFPWFTAGPSNSRLSNKQNKPAVLCCAGSTGGIVGVYWKFKDDLRKWCDKQSLPVGAAAYIAVECFQSAVFAVVWRSLCERIAGDIPISELEQQVKPNAGIYYPLLLSLGGGHLIVARSYAVFKASTLGIPYVMNRLRGKEETDLLTCMVAGFLTPVMYSLVAGMRDPVIIQFGVVSALVCGVMFDEVKVVELLAI